MPLADTKILFPGNQVCRSQTKQTNYAFIDTNNLYLTIKRLGWKIDWFKFRKYLKNRFHIKRAFIFIGERKKHKEIYDDFESAGFEVIFKKVIERGDETKGNVDIDIAIWTVHYIDNYDKAILITGDGDFYSLADYLCERDKLFCVAAPDKFAYSALFRKFKRVYVSEWKNKIEYKKD